eukprot:g117.t1
MLPSHVHCCTSLTAVWTVAALMGNNISCENGKDADHVWLYCSNPADRTLSFRCSRCGATKGLGELQPKILKGPVSQGADP